MRSKSYTCQKSWKTLLFFVFKTSRFSFKNVRPPRAAKLTSPLIFGIFIFFSIQPGYNDTLYNEVLGKRNNFLRPSNSKINEPKPRYDETSLQQKNLASLLRLAVHSTVLLFFNSHINRLIPQTQSNNQNWKQGWANQLKLQEILSLSLILYWVVPWLWDSF